MDNKFYVSYEAARLLKEKGYDKGIEDFDFVYLKDGSLSPRVFLHTSPFISAPTKAEVIEWLESKGIMIDINWIRFNENRRWNYSIFNCSTCDAIDIEYICTTRLEAEGAAIIKALELL